MDEELWEVILSELELRDLQKEAARAICTMQADNNSIYKFNKQAHHNSHMWYKAVIKEYIMMYGDLPSQVGPGTEMKFVLDD